MAYYGVQRTTTKSEKERDEQEIVEGCNLYDRIKLWWVQLKNRDFNPVTLKIKDLTLRENFFAQELLQVKTRVEICTLIYVVFFFIAIVLQWDDKGNAIELLMTVGDVMIAFIILTIIGRKWAYVHHYTLVTIVLTRAAWSLTQVYFVLHKVEPFHTQFDYYSWNQMMLFRILVPGSMLFLTDFRSYLFCMPIAFLIHCFMLSRTKQVYEQEGMTTGPIFENFELSTTIMRDLTQTIYISMGIFSHARTLVTRFITYEQSQLQQKQLTKVFHEQTDGLVVLKPRYSAEGPPDTSGLNQSTRPLRKTTLQVIQDQLQQHDEQGVELCYDVLFQNRAIEQILGFENIQSNLHTPTLLLQQNKLTLHEMTTKKDEELSKYNAKVVKREDHIHLDRSSAMTLEQGRIGQLVPQSNKTETNSLEDKPDDMYVSLRKQEIIFDQERCLLLSLRDITSSQILEKTKEQINLLRKLHNTISQDLVDPLSLIIVSVNWLILWKKKQAASQEQSDEVLEKLYNILVASKMTLFKCKDLLEMNQSADLSPQQQNLTNFKLYKATQEISNIVELQSRGRKIRVKVDYETDVLKHSKFLGDATRYQQVLLNILSNAVKFTPAEGCIDVKISKNSLQQNDEYDFDLSKTLLSVIVTDHGPGISQEDQAQLFQPFKTLRDAKRINPKGVGIGLYVCKMICEKLGGDICCFSNGRDTGSTFEFRVQLQETYRPRHVFGAQSSGFGSGSMGLLSSGFSKFQSRFDPLGGLLLPVGRGRTRSNVMEEQKQGDAAAQPENKNCTIICVDDNFVNLNSMRLMIEMMNYPGHINCFQNSQLALDFIFNSVLFTGQSSEKFELQMLITDAQMPIMNGVQLIEEIIKLYESYKMTQQAIAPIGQDGIKMPVFFMYSENGKNLKRSSKLLNIDYVVSKPIQYEQLKGAMQSSGVLPKKQQPAALNKS